ncbi:hypothetical protein AD998_17290 [bacterium 336/3]|nr:hypothetical protein AD998_17290 [bacterium 336/3]
MMIRISFFLIVYFSILSQTFSQKYTDYKPKYNRFGKRYLIDKIEHTNTETIFYFSYISEYEHGTVIFFGNKHPERWCVQNADNPKEVFYHTDVKNIRKNEKLMVSSLGSTDEVSYETNKDNIFTCEIHFEKLPDRVKKAHIWEGLDMKNSARHFHFLNVKLKTSDNPDLGVFKDMIERLKNFEVSVIGKVKSKWLLSN